MKMNKQAAGKSKEPIDLYAKHCTILSQVAVCQYVSKHTGFADEDRSEKQYDALGPCSEPELGLR